MTVILEEDTSVSQGIFLFVSHSWLQEITIKEGKAEIAIAF